MNTQARKSTHRAILYSRVSTDDQAQRGYSLRDQEARLREHCHRQGIEVAAHFQDDHSAKTFERPEFKKLLAFANANRGSVDLLLVLKWDRFSRNVTESYAMLDRLKRIGLKVEAIEQPLSDDPESKILRAIFLAVPEVDNARRAQATRDGMRRAMIEGRYPAKPPMGYSKGRDENDRPLMHLNDDASAIREAFEMVASGIFLPTEALLHIRRRGIRCSKNQLYKLLRNPVYAGFIRVPAYREEPERLVPSLHEPLVDEATYRRVGSVLDASSRKEKGPRPRRRPEFPLRGHLTCAHCGSNLTASATKGNGGVYHYYHCQSPCRERFRADDAHDALASVLRSVRIAPEVCRLYLAVLEDIQSEKEGSRDEARRKLLSEIAEINERLTDVDEKYVGGGITPEAYGRLLKRYQERRKEGEDRLAELQAPASRFIEEARYGLSLLSDLPHYYAQAGIEAKDRILGSIFPEKLMFQDGSYRTASVCEAIRLLRGKQPILAKNGTGPTDRTGRLSLEVPPVGLEPARLLTEESFFSGL